MSRIDTHHHMVPPDYQKALREAGIGDAGGRTMPDWRVRSGRCRPWPRLTSPRPCCRCPPRRPRSWPIRLTRPRLRVTSTTTPPTWSRASPTGSASSPPCRCRMSTRPVAEAVRALDDLKADGLVLLANHAGVYIGEEGQDELFAALDARSAVVFIHPAELPGPTPPGITPWTTDFLLDTTRAAYLLVRNGIRQRYPNIKFILSHGGGFVPYASYRMAVGIFADTGRDLAESLDEFAGFYFDTALSSTAAALPYAARVRQARSHHVRIGLAVRTAGTGEVLRRRAGGLLGNRRRHPIGDRPHQRALVVPAVRHCAATDSVVGPAQRIRHTGRSRRPACRRAIVIVSPFSTRASNSDRWVLASRISAVSSHPATAVSCSRVSSSSSTSAAAMF